MWITIATPPFATLEQFDELQEHLGGNPDGLRERYVGPVDGGLRVVVVWESQEHAERFFANTLGPALAQVLGPEPVGRPQVVAFEAARSYVRETIS